MITLFAQILAALLISANLVSSVCAQGLPQDVFYSIDDFSKVLVSHKNPYNTAGGEATDAQNVRVNEQFGSLAKRSVLNTLGTCSHTAYVTGLHRYYKSDSTKYTVTTADQYVDYISDQGVCTNLLTGESTGKRWTFVTYKNNEIGTNGNDLPIKWDGKLTVTADTAGARTAGDLVSQLGAPYATISAGAGLTASRWYQYKIAYYDGTTYKYSTARSNPLLLGTVNKQITLTDIPLGPAGVTSRIIYRTAGDTTRANVVADNTFYQVATISDDSTSTYVDSIADATIAADAAPTWATVSAGENVSPPHGRYAFIQKERLWLGNDPSGTSYGKSTVYYSEVGNPNYFRQSINYYLIRPDDGDEIQGVTSFLSTLTILKTNSISKIYTDSATTSQWQISQPFSFIGCYAPYSIVSTPVGIIYVGRYGIYKFDGQDSTLISDVVTKDVKDINSTNYNNMAAVFYNNEYRLAYASQSTGAGNNDRVLIFDLIRNAYVKDTESVNVWAVFGSADDFGALYSGSSSTDGKMLAHTTQPSNLVYRYQSQLTAGTYDSVYISGTEDDPVLSLGWDKTWTTVTGAWNAQGSKTWTVSQSPGYWYSPIVQINASALSKLYWNQVVGSAGGASIAIKTGASSGAVNAAVWSSEFTNPSGSDISSLTGNTYIQFRVKLTTSDFTYTPYLFIQDDFMIKLVYSQTGTAAETAILSLFKSGWLDLIPSSQMGMYTNYPKLIKEIDVYYEGTAGTVNLQLNNLKGDVAGNFDIDLSKNRLATKDYYGDNTSKVFRWLPTQLVGQTNYLYGDRFKMIVTENGVTGWKIQRIVFRYDVEGYVPYK